MALSPRRPPPWLLLLAPLFVAGCALPPPAPGTGEADLRQRWGAPTDTHVLPDGGRRLEYATGPMGRSTWMIDLGADGRVRQARQVLSPESLWALPVGTLDRQALRRELGRPGEVRGVHGGGETWFWRYETNDCLWLAASIDREGRFTGGALLPDPACDAPSDAFS